MDGASSVPPPKKCFSLEIASYCDRATLANLERRTNQEGAYPKAGGLTLRFIKSVVEAFGEGRRGHGPTRPAYADSPENAGCRNGFSTACGVNRLFDYCSRLARLRLAHAWALRMFRPERAGAAIVAFLRRDVLGLKTFACSTATVANCGFTASISFEVSGLASTVSATGGAVSASRFIPAWRSRSAILRSLQSFHPLP